MKAILMAEPGPADVLVPTRITDPRIDGPTQLKIRLRAAGINPVDTKIRRNGLLGKRPLPTVLGCDGAGEVVEVGEAVTRFKVGDAVWFCNGGIGDQPGNYAEFTKVDEAVARPKPASLSFEQAAAGPLALITAWESLFDRANLQAGQTCLIHAGAGGVGHLAIQLARHVGARVITTVSSEAKAEFVRSLGADEVIFYEDEDFVERTLELTGGKGADLVFDTVGSDTFRLSLDCVAHFGDLVTLLDPGPEVNWANARRRNLRIAFELMLTPMLEDLPQARAHHGEILDRCAELIEAGKLRIHVSDTLVLEQASEAHRRIEKGGVIGKLVLKIG